MLKPNVRATDLATQPPFLVAKPTCSIEGLSRPEMKQRSAMVLHLAAEKRKADPAGPWSLLLAAAAGCKPFPVMNLRGFSGRTDRDGLELWSVVPNR